MDHKSDVSLCVTQADTGKRLDVLISEQIAGLSRSFAAGLIKNGHIRIDQESRKPGYLVKFGERISCHIPRETPCKYLPEPIDLSILFEDDQLIVINKPPGMVVHPAPGHSSGTLVNALLHHCPDLPGIGGEIRPGIVHRLDKDTSGVLVAAKTDAALHSLAGQFKKRTVNKEYIALVKGGPAASFGRIELPVGRHPTDRKKMSTRSKKGRIAITEWDIMERFTGFCLLRLKIKTGRTHQIRVHMAAMGHPVVGDPVYGRQRTAKGLSRDNADLVRSARRQLLHAARLIFVHPQTKTAMSFEADMPRDMAEIIDTLRKRKEVRRSRKSEFQ